MRCNMKDLKLIIPEFIQLVQSTKNLSEKTITAYTSDLNDFNSFVINHELSTESILQYIQELTITRRLKDTTINRKLIMLKMFFEYLHSKNYIESNYFSSHQFKFKKEKRLPKTLAIKETSKLLSCVTEQYINANSDFEKWKTSRNLALIDILISKPYSAPSFFAGIIYAVGYTLAAAFAFVAFLVLVSAFVKLGKPNKKFSVFYNKSLSLNSYF